ncbi:MAG: hypothetical protein ISS78_00585 [Phycisphaerae bacterium]|nr:hypothetical protein [Phycisphaerae bacterium]
MGIPKLRRGCMWIACLVLLWPAILTGKLRMVHTMAAGGTPPAGTTGKRGLHIPRTKRANFTWQVNDGAGFRWDVQYYGSIGQGTNYAYSGGLYCQVSGSNITGKGIGWINAAGDEIEIGPYIRNNIKCYRRVKIFKDRGLARWLDIFENPGAAAVTVPIAIYSCTNNTVNRTVSSTGGGVFGQKDWAFVTKTTNPQTPALLHLVCGRRSKLRPTVQLQNNQIYVRYSLTVPAGKTAVLCYFESQGNSFENHVKMMKTFRVSRAINDLAMSVRKLIVNWASTGGLDGVELDRTENADTVIDPNGDSKFGTITNESFTIQTIFGELKLPASQVIGMACEKGPGRRVRVAMTNGQIVCGKVGETKLLFKPSVGTSVLQIPLSRVRQWSFRISKDRPQDVPFVGPVAILRTGDRLAFEAKEMKLKFRTRHGTVDLAPAHLVSINMDNSGNAVHRVTFLNGSFLGGFLEPPKLLLPLKIGTTLEIPRDMIVQMVFATEDKENRLLTRVILTNQDELLGKLDVDSIKIKTDSGMLKVKPENIKSLAFSRSHLGRTVVQLWDTSTYRGQLQRKNLTVQIMPGPALNIYIGQLAGIIRPQALPPEEVLTSVEKYVAQLGAESYKDREAAKKALIKLGKGIIPLLKKYIRNGDPQVRQGIEDIIEKLGGTSAARIKPPVAMPLMIKGWGG